MQDQRKRRYTHKFPLLDQKKIIEIFKNYDNKSIALKKIRSSIPDCKYLSEQKILHWMSKSKTGKAISSEFEDEVMDKVKQLCHLSNRATYSYSAVRECAIKIFDKDYWDDNSKSFIKKWHHDKRTYKLQFTNKWVVGMLKRNLFHDTTTNNEQCTVIELHQSVTCCSSQSLNTNINDNDTIDSVTSDIDFDKFMEFPYEFKVESSSDNSKFLSSSFDDLDTHGKSSSHHFNNYNHQQNDSDLDSFEFDDILEFESLKFGEQ
jgi:hypothetical protein